MKDQIIILSEREVNFLAKYLEPKVKKLKQPIHNDMVKLKFK